MRTAAPWKLLLDEVPLPGPRNMAVDEVLFRKAAGGAATFLRFYQWDRPTASLGYSQDVRRVLDADFCRANGIGVVRRITGGKLVLHHREVTYAVASSDVARFGDTVADSYRLISRALMNGLELMGLSPKPARSTPDSYVRGAMPCFAAPARDEIEIGGRKIVGSAQKRTGPVFLQHGSIPLLSDPRLLAAVSAPGAGSGPADPGMTSLSEELGRPVDFSEAADFLGRGFSEFFKIGLEPLIFDAADLDAVSALEASKYGNDLWTFSRRTARPHSLS
jgi:lipoate-protein ligase A